MKEGNKNVGLHNLPLSAQDYIKLVAKKMRYRRKVRADVTAELAGHFEDELRGCKTDEEKQAKAQQVIEAFGDPKLLAVLMCRAKKRCRPLWRTVIVRTFQTIGVIILLLVIYTAWFLSGRPVISTDYVSEVNRITRPAADENSNAWPFYEEALKLYVKEPNEPGNLMDSAKTWPDGLTQEQSELLEKLISDNKACLEKIKLATQKPFYWCHYESPNGDMMSIMIYYLSDLRTIANLLVLRAKMEAKGGRIEEALDGIKSCYILGKHLKGDKTVIEQIVGIAIEQLALKELCVNLNRHKLTSPQLSELQKDFEKITADENFQISLKFEKLFLYDEIQRCFTSDGIGGGHIYFKRFDMTVDLTANPENQGLPTIISQILFTHPNKKETLRAAVGYYAYLEKYVLKTPYEVYNEQIDIGQKQEGYASNNLLLKTLLPTFKRIIERTYQQKANANAALVIIAVLRYKEDKGIYPENLQSLIEAGYIKELPMDPYSDKPLVYKRAGEDFTLYSVGPNFYDDGGTSAKDYRGKYVQWADNGDAVFWPVQK